MQPYELTDLINGLDHKYRVEWEIARTSSFLNMSPHCKKKLDKKKILQFPWDKEDYDQIEKRETEISNEDVERLKKMAEKFKEKNMH